MWLNSAHVSEVDTQLNRAMRIIGGTLMPTPLPWLPVVCNIAPPEVRRKAALKKELLKISSNHSLPIHHDFPPEESRLVSRKPPLRLGSQLLKEDFTPASYWADQWDGFRGNNNRLIGNPAAEVSGMNLPRREWVLLNRFRTGVGTCNYCVNWDWWRGPVIQLLGGYELRMVVSGDLWMLLRMCGFTSALMNTALHGHLTMLTIRPIRTISGSVVRIPQ